MRVAIVTCEQPFVPDLEGGMVMDAVKARGDEARMEVWNDPAVDWSSYDVAWISSTWDYHERIDEFRAWLERAEGETTLENERALVEWNFDKRYLRELEAEGVPMVPTVWSEPGGEDAAQAAVVEEGWSDVVVKPTVDLNAENLRRGTPKEVAAALRDIDSPGMAQPYLPSLMEEGELSLVYLRGEPSHAVRKVPAEGEFRVQEVYGGRYAITTATAEAVDVGRRTLAALDKRVSVGKEPLYTRVDIVRGLDDELCLIELELIEPSLFMEHAGREKIAEFARLLAS